MRRSIALTLGMSSLAVADGILGSTLAQLTSLGQSAVDQLKSGPPQANPPFNAQQQHIDVTGVHAWVAPGPDDERGPCPGLNALANHGYLPHSGFATIFDLTSATTQVYGMGLDLAAALAAYGGVLDGAAAAWSIGGQQHTGISGSHNNYETDASPIRGDLNQYGSNSDLVMSQFKELLNMQPDPATANYDVDILGKFRENRFHESIAKNPYFYYGPFSGVAVSQAAHTFIYRLMANHSAEHPAGLMDQETLKSFFAVSGDGDDLTWTAGHERIPDNWYRRADGDEYGLQGLGSDMGAYFKAYPDIRTPGCNTGTVNSFTPTNVTDNDPKHYDFGNPQSVFCYGLAEAIVAGQSTLSGVAGGVGGIVGGIVQEILLPLQNALGCVTVPSLNETVAQACPGYSLYGGPTAPVAPGAIQN